MQILPLFSFLAAAIYLSLAIHVVRSDPRAAVNRVFGTICATFAVCAFAYTFQLMVADEASVWPWHRASSIGWGLGPFLMLVFAALLTRNGWLGKRPWLFALLGLPALVLWWKALFGILTAVAFRRTDQGWVGVLPTDSPWFFAFLVYYLSYTLIGFAMVFRWGWSSREAMHRKQAHVVAGAGVLGLVLVTISDVVLPTFGIETYFVTPILILVWLVPIWFAMDRYRLMVLTLDTAAPEILKTMADGVLLVDASGRILAVNAAAARMFDRHDRPLVGADVADLFPGETLFRPGALSAHLVEAPLLNVEITFTDPSCEVTPLSLSASAVGNGKSVSRGAVLVLRDNTDRKKAEEDLRHVAMHDPLTDLPNRAQLRTLLDQAIARSRRDGRHVALLLLDLDHFKQVNDVLGHSVGDLLLQSVARRLLEATRSSDTVARMGGDEFVVVLGDLDALPAAVVAAQRILDAFAAPFRLDPNEIHATFSIGVSTFPADGDSVETMMKNADMALYLAKARGRNACEFFSTELGAEAAERVSMEAGLRSALERQEFVVHYQPVVALGSGRIEGVEALVRWDHPQRGLVSPLKFLPVAEQTGLIIPLGRWVLRTACAQCAAWRADGLRAVPVAVNLAAPQFKHPGLIDDIADVMRTTGMVPGLLEVEITESTIMRDPHESAVVLGRLHDLGVRIVVDNFGSDHSSLHKLRKLPIDAVKIDRFFIQAIAEDPRNAAVVKAILAMADSLGFQVIAEGVETSLQLQTLKALLAAPSVPLHCDLAQGFFLARPAEAGAVALLLAEGSVPGSR